MLTALHLSTAVEVLGNNKVYRSYPDGVMIKIKREHKGWSRWLTPVG
jgi:hypothetical protein